MIRIQFTPHELDLFRMAAHSNADAAMVLKIEEQTVKEEWRTIYGKLGIVGHKSKRTQALMMTLRDKYLGVNEVSAGDRRVRDIGTLRSVIGPGRCPDCKQALTKARIEAEGSWLRVWLCGCEMLEPPYGGPR